MKTQTPIGPSEEFIQQRIAEQRREDHAGAIAAATPLPGATREAFALVQDISCGKYSVRPFYDIDFEFLQMLEHPLYEAMVAASRGGTATTEYFPRGQAAWNFIWMLTRPVDDVEACLAAQDGVKALQAQARKEFGRCQIGTLKVLNDAAMEQMRRYWLPVISYGAPENKNEQGEEAAKASRPPSMAVWQTALVGS